MVICGSLSTVNVEDHNGQQERVHIGDVLERKRREKGLSLKDVEQATKIRTRYLDGLEREDYSVLPDAVYVQGFLKTYANFLGLDGEQLSRELKGRRGPRRERHLNHEGPRMGEFEQPLINPGGISGVERRKVSGATVLTITLGVILLTAVIGGLYLVGSRSASGPGGEPETQREAPEESAPGSFGSGTGSSSEEVTAPATDPVQVTVRVSNAASGLTIRTDGTVAYEQVAQPGFSQTFEARDAIIVEARNAGAVQVEANGQDVGSLGNYGQPVTREFTPRSQGS